jgi:uncharacterized protein (TIGR03086 family)
VSAQVDLLESVLNKTGDLMAAVPPDARSRPTPCGDFDVETLVGHLAEWCTTFAASAAGEPPPSVGDGGEWPEPATDQFRAAAQHAVAAFRNGAEDRALTLLGGPIPGQAVAGMMIMEYLGHGWDLAVGTGQPIPFSNAEAEAALATGRQMLSADYRGPDKSFGHEVPVPEGAPAVDRFIGFIGRDPSTARA